MFLESGALLLDALLALLLLTAAALWTAYVAHGSSALLDPQPSYAAYDAPAFSRARWLLPKKLAPALSSPAAASDPALRERLAQLRRQFGLSLDEPGGAGRWGLPDADGELDRLAALMEQAHQLSELYVWYGMVQALGLVLLVFRLMRVGRVSRPAPAPPAWLFHIHLHAARRASCLLVGVQAGAAQRGAHPPPGSAPQVWAFQGRLGAITQTVVAMVAPMAHFLLLLLLCMLTFAAMVHISVGHRLPAASTLGAALYDSFMALLGGAQLGGGALLRGGGAQSGVEVAAAALAYLCQQLLLVVLLTNFFLAIIGDTFSAVKKARARAGEVRLLAPGIPTLRRRVGVC